MGNRTAAAIAVSDAWERAWERDRWRKRAEAPGFAEAERERFRLYRQRKGTRTRSQLTDEAKARKAAQKEARQAAEDARPFIGVDGEGVRTGGGNRAHYALLRVGEKELFAGGRRLITPEMLAFLIQHIPPDAIAVGFAVNYDASNILIDVPRIKPAPHKRSPLEMLLSDSYAWTWLNFQGWPTFGVHYRPGKHLKICYGTVDRKTGKRIPRPGTTRWIYDVWADFQGTFLSALQKWEIGDAATLARIKKGKDARQDFETITPEIRAYCAEECSLLADLMTKFRETVLAIGIRPKLWNGAGNLAGAMYDHHGTLTRRELEGDPKKDVPGLVRHCWPTKDKPACGRCVLCFATGAYYGGRFEATRVGWVGGRQGGGPVYEHDISSAYPAMMRRLPCLRHGRWRRAEADELARLCRRDTDEIFVCPATFEHPRSAFLCGLPFRDKRGALAWPRAGNGTYWSVELRSARRLGAKITPRGGWLFEPGCDCRPFDWVEAYYAERKRIGKSGKGYALRLGINALYGKLAQRIGTPKYSNPIWAGLITAMTRAALNDAILAAGPESVVMLATDAVYTVGKPAPLDRGDELGQWERKKFARLFIVRPGLYWPSRPRGKAAVEWKLKSKGYSSKFFEAHVPIFHKAWRVYLRRCDDPALTLTPIITINPPIFVGLRYANQIKRPDLACQWIGGENEVEHPIEIRFGDRGEKGLNKRAGAWWSPDRRGLVLGCKAGDPAKRSHMYRRGAELASNGEWELTREMWEALPDMPDLTMPFKAD